MLKRRRFSWLGARFIARYPTSSVGGRKPYWREDAERFIEEVRGEEPDLADHLRIQERGLEAGGLN